MSYFLKRAIIKQQLFVLKEGLRGLQIKRNKLLIRQLRIIKKIKIQIGIKKIRRKKKTPKYRAFIKLIRTLRKQFRKKIKEKGYRTKKRLKKRINRKRFLGKKYFPKTIDIISSELYFENFLKTEYIEDDFFFNEKILNTITGFTFKLKSIFFSNIKYTRLDFIEKYFILKKHKNYVKELLTTFKIMTSKSTKYVTLILLKPIKGGYKIFSLNLIGIVPNNHLTYLKKKKLNYILNNKQYALSLIKFFTAFLTIFWYSNPKTVYKKHSIFKSTLFFLKKK